MRAIFAVVLLAGASFLHGAEPDIAIYAQAFNGYTRTRLPDHSLKPETYVFAEGARHSPIRNASLDDLKFEQIGHMIAGPLKRRGYVPSFDPKHTDFVLFVYWGMTQGAENGDYSNGESVLGSAMAAARDQSPGGGEGTGFGSAEANLSSATQSDLAEAQMLQGMFNGMRDRNNAKNAALLGYRDKLERAWAAPWMSVFQDAITEIEMDRYYVILIAIDYDTLVHKKAYKLMWESRFSIPARGKGFDERLPSMAQAASRYFGEDLRRLVHDRVPDGRVEVGTPTVVEQPTKTAAPAK